MRQLLNALLLLAWLIGVWLPLAAPPAVEAARALAAVQQEGSPETKELRKAAAKPTPTPTRVTPASPDVQSIFDRMTVADKVGQLFLVTFQGDDVSENSDIATLVRDYRAGGVVLLPANGNFRSAPIAVSESPAAGSGNPAQESVLSTPQQIVQLANTLQSLALSPARPVTMTTTVSGQAVTTTIGFTNTAAISTTVALTETKPISPTVTATPKKAPAAKPTEAPTPSPPATIPLLIGLDWAGDDSSIFSGREGFTPLPSEMAIGATWSPSLAEKAGQILGQELEAVGVNLLLGPTLDVLDVPRPGNKGDLDTRTFGGDPFWVGQIGQAFIRGVQTGSGRSVLTAAKHFPGQGGSDRRPEDEVATVQKSMQELRQIELAPFAAITVGSDLEAPGITPALMTSHIRYRGFQGNIRQLTPPISLAPQLQDLMGLQEFANWRAAGGVLISDALGVPALRRYYDPALQKFPYRQVAQDAFLAGNDQLFLSRFALTDDWSQQLQAMKETILFFQDKYRSDSEFRARVDAAVKRIIRLKLDLYGGQWQPESLQRDPADVNEKVGLGAAVTQSVARSALTLIYPGRDELADRMPSAPLVDENILIITDARKIQECATCEPVSLLPRDALQEIILRLYGPLATGQVMPGNIRSITFQDLNQLLTEPTASDAQSIEGAIAKAKWIVFAQLDYSPEEYPDSAALRNFLSKRSDSLREKRLVVMAFSAPYYLDTTEISKLTAYFGVYAKSGPFLETAVRALFREFSPTGGLPVSVSGINYELIKQLEPAPGQIISLAPIEPAEVISSSIQVGSQIALQTGVIFDRNGHPVPDGTPVEFHRLYPAEGLALAPTVETTTGGKARTTVVLDRPGDLWITVQAGEAGNSTRVELKVGGDTPGSIATVVPTPTPQPTPTLTPTLLPTPRPTLTPESTPVPSPTPEPAPPPPPKPRVGLSAFLYALAGTVVSSGAAFAAVRGRERKRSGLRRAESRPSGAQPVVAALWAGLAAWTAYVLYAVGWLPGATKLQIGGHAWVAGAVTLAAGMLSLLWSGWALRRNPSRSDER